MPQEASRGGGAKPLVTIKMKRVDEKFLNIIEETLKLYVYLDKREKFKYFQFTFKIGCLTKDRLNIN